MKLVHNSISLESSPQIEYVVEEIDKKNVRLLSNTELKFDSINNSDIVGRIILTMDKDEWIAYTQMYVDTKMIITLEVNKKYRGMGFRVKALELFEDAEYIFGEEDNEKTLNLYGKYWEKCTLRWVKLRPRKFWIGFYNPKIMNDVYFIDDSDIAGQGVFMNVELRGNSMDNYTTIVGPAFKQTSQTGDPDQDYTRTMLGKYVNHSNTPNLYLLEDGQVFYYATNEEILKGEELTIDYNEFPWEGKRDF